jgi:hypothetical protein
VITTTNGAAVREAQERAGAGTPDILTEPTEEITEQE